ncbi:oxidoreductase [Desulfosporosinus fructosivorans]
MFDQLFSPFSIRGKTIKNRCTVPAMVTDFCNEDGTATERYIAYHEEKAKGGWGLIITEDYNVDPLGHGFKATAGLWNDDQIKSHSELPKRVHKYGTTILAQIYHCGRQTNSGAIDGLPRSSSAIMCPFGDEIPVPLTTEEVKEMVGKYGDTALRAKKCGFDGVEIHGAHGYLITQFLSLYSNKRIDEYGGNFWNRTRFAREIIKDIREKCGEDFIIGMRISADEFVEGGLTIEDNKAIARMMEAEGLDIIHVSVGNYLSVDLNVASSHSSHGWFTDWAKAIKDVVSIPVITVSRINDPFLADSILASNKADFIAMGRASLADPEMPTKAQEGRFEDIRRCIGCNDGCIGTLFNDEPIRCVLNPELGLEYEGGIQPAEVKKNITVVGSGPAGLYAAITAAKAGHQVTVYEKGEHAGGQFYIAAIPPTKGEITDFIVWQLAQCKKLGVHIKYNTEATLELIKKTNPDSIILASGSEPILPPISGLKENSKTTFAKDILDGKVKPGSRCVIIGGGQVGAETAHFLSQMLKDVTVVEMKDTIASDAPLAIQWHLTRALKERNVIMLTGTSVVRVNENAVIVKDSHGIETELPADTIIVAAGYRAFNPLAEELAEANVNVQVQVIGDAKQVRNVLAATTEGYLAGKTV